MPADGTVLNWRGIIPAGTVFAFTSRSMILSSGSTTLTFELSLIRMTRVSPPQFDSACWPTRWLLHPWSACRSLPVLTMADSNHTRLLSYAFVCNHDKIFATIRFLLDPKPRTRLSCPKGCLYASRLLLAPTADPTAHQAPDLVDGLGGEGVALDLQAMQVFRQPRLEAEDFQVQDSPCQKPRSHQ
jgi:hypothetical protein